MNRIFTLLPLYLALAGCQWLPTQSAPAVTAEPSENPSQTSSPVATKDFDNATLLALLTAEIAGQRQEFDYALQTYTEIARNNDDPAIARRAFFIAEYMDAPEQALQNAEAWSQAAPDDLEAQRAFAIQLASRGQLTRAMSIMEELLQVDAETNFDFLALSASQANPQTRANLLDAFKQLSRKHPQNLQIIYGYALLLDQAGNYKRALRVVQSHKEANQFTAPLLLQVSLLSRMDRKPEALQLLKQAVQLRPDDFSIRLNHARLLIELEHLEEARGEFLELNNQFPENDDIRLSLGFEDLIERETQLDAAHFYLGLAYEGMGRYQEALETHKLVAPSYYFLNAQQRVLELMLQLQSTDNALAYSELQRQRYPDLLQDLYLLQAGAFKEHEKQPDIAWSLINQALEELPDEIPLLYTRAMFAESLGDLNQLETDLRQVLSLDANNAMAMNALGYTLLERTDRLAEAQQLIEQAHALDPEEPATQDSLGWLYFKLDRLDEAEKWLRKAYEAYPDTEVAAHLAETLWQKNKKREARKVLKSALEEAPDSTLLLDTIKRLTGKDSL